MKLSNARSKSAAKPVESVAHKYGAAACDRSTPGTEERDSLMHRKSTWIATRKCPNCAAQFTKDVGGRCPLCHAFLRERSRQPAGANQRRKSPEWMRKVNQLRLRDGNDCWLCGHALGLNVTLDHVIPRSKGGGSSIENLRLAHYECNQRRGNADPHPQLEGTT
jgi:hypothetical protein